MPKGISHSCLIARYGRPQKQTHQIAITALRNAAPARDGWGPDRIGRLPSFHGLEFDQYFVDEGITIGQRLPWARSGLGRTDGCSHRRAAMLVRTVISSDGRLSTCRLQFH